MVGELAAALAHELRQPLTAMLSNAEAALDLLGPGVIDFAGLQEILGDVVAEGRRAGEVIKRLRSLLTKSRFEPQAINLNDVIREVAPLLHGKALLNEVSVTLELAPSLPCVRGDRIQLHQVLLNLMVNALEAMATVPPAQRKLVVRTAQVDPPAVQTSVEDSGVGIPPDKLERVFDSFFTTKADGMGTGLSICRSIIQAHAGRIWVANNSAHGATFSFVLPVAAKAAP